MAAESSDGPVPSVELKLPYKLTALNWDEAHHFNSQNRYGYTGRKRKLCDPALQCDTCEQWFLVDEVGCVGADAGFVAFQRNYRFTCRVCGGGEEQWELLPNPWSSVVMTAMLNLLLDGKGDHLTPSKWLKAADVTEWIAAHWGSLTTGRSLQQLRENSAVTKNGTPRANLRANSPLRSLPDAAALLPPQSTTWRRTPGSSCSRRTS